MKLYRFRHSNYARKVQCVLDWLGHQYELVEVPYSDRNELAALTGGYIYVPVLVTDTGDVLRESRDICEHLTQRGAGALLVPPALQAGVWAYHDWVDHVLEDLLFRIASPSVRDQWVNPGDRALYVLIKERKFGAGCVDAWLRDRDALLRSANKILAPSLRALEQQPFLFGSAPTLADAALYGNLLMLQEASPDLIARLSPTLVDFAARCAQTKVTL